MTQLKMRISAFKCVLLAVLLASSALLCSCGSLPSPEASEIADAVLASQPSGEDGFTAASDEEIAVIFGCDTSVYEDMAVMYSSDSGYADIIAVFKSSGSEVKEATQNMLDEFLDKRISDFRGYAPEEVKKIEQTTVISYGMYDILVIISDFDAARDAVDAIFND